MIRGKIKTIRIVFGSTFFLVACFLLLFFAKKQYDELGTWCDPVTGMEFVKVTGGCFEMGCEVADPDCYGDDQPKHVKCVSDYWIGKHEVTQGQWQEVMGENPSHFNLGPNYPIDQVSWNDAQKFITNMTLLNGEKHTFRLPTETEWEYACKSGGNNQKYCGSDTIGQVAWYSVNSGGTTHPVGMKKPNGTGLFDMSGNVREWCEDNYHHLAYEHHLKGDEVSNNKANFRVIRGGAWSYDPRLNRSTTRNFLTPEIRYRNLGFRLIMTPRNLHADAQ